MNFYLDCEWSEENLISMALVSEKSEFYEVLCCSNPSEWVKENVMPVLARLSISRIMFEQKLINFLSQFSDITIFVDWPEDIIRFCEVLIVGPGKRIGPNEIDFIFRESLGNAESKTPHNALEDARAMFYYDAV